MPSEPTLKVLVQQIHAAAEDLSKYDPKADLALVVPSGWEGNNAIYDVAAMFEISIKVSDLLPEHQCLLVNMNLPETEGFDWRDA